ncbi:MurT ligase domain-containing protein [Corynebacterium sp. 153RC1]|uniref:MurT ligase domain-containing protein n=1 Tax=unclassified Corynebacterium TaxID=2624378 RepID=UPI00211CDDDC|nr:MULTISPECIES: MurT ligase domain-containing protein [unclassified Corynebacterium]MCQ9352888.1 MurT ligase domain-containing protein [Corynebacterium sp. 209RC1]MCQ9355094.1 MurT ligase domain-containing protein [Corynebacterium sp. 1222RC1]MCQ9357456.1 MurT ligase domain-containing protein [Corynebacterium sp. 122RC1]MCQ9359835.1 MurT ligase domain-containing protein [Corynebacterium sp. 142RC1]MCQ9362051.1 MurT ligase domain-containing protein [Corynebacterium sp. 153RC1]
MKFAPRTGFGAGPLNHLRTHLAVGAATLATKASQISGRGSGGMIGGLVAEKIDPNIMANLSGGRPVALVTGTNGKSTTTRMLASAVRTQHRVATNEGGDNMDAGIISALMAGANATHVVLEVDELHVPAVADRLNPKVLVLLNLSRDQLDRVGEINKIERTLRECVRKHPEMTVVANCDDVLITSVAYSAKNVIWVAAGGGWLGDSVSCPRTGGHIVHEGEHWYAAKPLPTGERFERPTPDWVITSDGILSPHGKTSDEVASAMPIPLNLKLPGNANRGNATQAVAAAVAGFDIPLEQAVRAVEQVDDVAGRYSTIQLGEHQVHLLLAKNPAGWQEALSMVDRSAEGLVVAVNGQVADGEDLSWLWDVKFEDLSSLAVKAAGERSTDLAVRLTYAEVEHELIADPLAAIRACPPGRVEVLANYTAFRDLKKALLQAAKEA